MGTVEALWRKRSHRGVMDSAGQITLVADTDSASGFAGCVMARSRTLAAVSSSWTQAPESMVKSVAPIAQMSLRASMSVRASHCSGDMYSGVPAGASSLVVSMRSLAASTMS